MTKKQERINQGLRLLDSSYRITFFDPRMNVHNDWLHEQAKCKLIYNLKKDGLKVLGEAIFKNGARADIFVPELFRVYEILHSETEEECLAKTESYPEELEIFYIKSSEVL